MVQGKTSGDTRSHKISGSDRYFCRGVESERLGHAIQRHCISFDIRSADGGNHHADDIIAHRQIDRITRRARFLRNAIDTHQGRCIDTHRSDGDAARVKGNRGKVAGVAADERRIERADTQIQAGEISEGARGENHVLAFDRSSRTGRHDPVMIGGTGKQSANGGTGRSGRGAGCRIGCSDNSGAVGVGQTVFEGNHSRAALGIHTAIQGRAVVEHGSGGCGHNHRRQWQSRDAKR